MWIILNATVCHVVWMLQFATAFKCYGLPKILRFATAFECYGFATAFECYGFATAFKCYGLQWRLNVTVCPKILRFATAFRYYGLPRRLNATVCTRHSKYRTYRHTLQCLDFHTRFSLIASGTVHDHRISNHNCKIHSNMIFYDNNNPQAACFFL